MNNLKNVIIADVLNRSLYQLVDASLALGRMPYTAEKQSRLIVDKLQVIYSRDSFLSGIKPSPLFQTYNTLAIDESSLRKNWKELTQMNQQHLLEIEKELSKHTYHHESDESVNELIEDSENAYLDMLTEMSEPVPEYDVAYTMRYTLAGILTLNDVVIARPRLDSPADIALQEAFKTPNTTVVAKGNLSKFKHDIPLPAELKNLLLRVSSGKFKVTTTVTQAVLNEHHILKAEIDTVLEKLKPLR